MVGTARVSGRGAQGSGDGQEGAVDLGGGNWILEEGLVCCGVGKGSCRVGSRTLRKNRDASGTEYGLPCRGLSQDRNS